MLFCCFVLVGFCCCCSVGFGFGFGFFSFFLFLFCLFGWFICLREKEHEVEWVGRRGGSGKLKEGKDNHCRKIFNEKIKTINTWARNVAQWYSGLL